MAAYCQDGRLSCQIFLSFQGFFGSFQVEVALVVRCFQVFILFRVFKFRCFELSHDYKFQVFS